MSVVSDPGRGSPGTRERWRRSRVLIAEDDESLRTLLRLSIDIGELDIDEAALELARSNPPDVVLLESVDGNGSTFWFTLPVAS